MNRDIKLIENKLIEKLEERGDYNIVINSTVFENSANGLDVYNCNVSFTWQLNGHEKPVNTTIITYINVKKEVTIIM